MNHKTQVLTPNDRNIDYCAELLSRDELVAVPSETVYGLAGNALSESAVEKIFSVKGRPYIDPLISHFADSDSAAKHINAPKILEQLADTFWPGPLTVVVPKRPNFPNIVTAGLDSVAIRVPNNPLFLALLRKLDFPLAAPSANSFSYVSPTCAEHVMSGLGGKITAILDSGPTNFGIESTILDLRAKTEFKILRPGPITPEQISDAIGIPVSEYPSGQSKATRIDAPGMLEKHYSPLTKLSVFVQTDDTLHLEFEPNAAYVFQKRPDMPPANIKAYWLSEDGDLTTVAHNLFALIRKLDQMQLDEIHVELSPYHGIGVAINDRLNRAARKSNSSH
ncbi:MAG: L-threonylcarbamoyladenylate synthase [Verrucomicrobiota bacterium]